SLAATNAGVIIGTAAYMAPEQARGSAADARSDVFSFGCVLYEMLSGRQAFQGDTVSDVLASVLARDPDLSSLSPKVPPRIVELLRRSLEKNPKRRWHAVADIRVEIEAILADPQGMTASVATVQRPLWKRSISVTAAVLLTAALTSAVWYFRPSRALT